jgi:hypothetical protein
MTVVLLLALTVMVALPLPEGMGMVWMPVPTAGMVTAVPTLVSTAGWVGMTESAGGWVGMAVSAAGWPVTTPSELVAVRNDVWGKASMEEVTAAAAEETDWGGMLVACLGAGRLTEGGSIDLQSPGQRRRRRKQRRRRRWRNALWVVVEWEWEWWVLFRN